MYWACLLEALQAAVGRLGVRAHHGRLLYEDQLQGVNISGGHHEPEMFKYEWDERSEHAANKQIMQTFSGIHLNNLDTIKFGEYSRLTAFILLSLCHVY